LNKYLYYIKDDQNENLDNTLKNLLADSIKDIIFLRRSKTDIGVLIMDLIVRVKEIKGTCPVYSSGDSIVIRDGYILDAKNSAEVCMHSLGSLMPYYVALSRGIAPKSLGLSGPKEGVAYLQCLDPCELTGGGTVIFEISLANKNGSVVDLG
jgi:uncharacterized repeat protein (TIGR04076 family)